MPEVKVIAENIENLKTSTGAKIETDKEGKEIDRRVLTKVQFEAEISASALANIHSLMANKAPVHVLIGSPQTIMKLVETKEPVTA